MCFIVMNIVADGTQFFRQLSLLELRRTTNAEKYIMENNLNHSINYY